MFDLFTYSIYLGLLFIVMALLYLGRRKPARKKEGNDSLLYSQNLGILHYLALLLISIVVGYRYEVGVDWEAYVYWYDFIARPHISVYEQPMEWGYFMINKAVSSLDGSYMIMFTIVAFLSWYFVFKSLNQLLLPLLIFFLFVDGFFFWSMNGVRQFIAIGIFLYSIKYIVEKRIILYLFCIFLGSLFHISSLLLIPLYFIPYQKLYNQKVWFAIFFTSLFVTNVPAIMGIIEEITINLISYIPIFGKYLEYFETNKAEATGIDGTGLGYLFRIIITFIILFFSHGVVKNNSETKVYFILFFIGAVLTNLFLTVQIVSRFLKFFLILRPVVLSFIIYYIFINNKNYEIIALGIIGLYLLLFLNSIYQGDNMSNPFRFVYMSSI